MAEKIVSPGVFTNEIDQSALPAGIASIGAAVIGPTSRGPANIPTTVTSYSEFVAKFGGVFTLGTGVNESTYKYLTNYSAQEYLKYADTLTVVRTLPNDSSTAFSNVVDRSGTGTISFRLDTLSAGAQENSGISAASTAGSGSTADVTTGGRLVSGTETNLRWEVSNVNTTKGTFTLLIRRGDDITNRKIILEQYNNLTLDPTSPNYISKRVGDVSYTLLGSGTSDPYFQVSGSYPNVSKYVRVSNVSNTTVFFDQNGKIRINSLSGSLPQEVSGTFSGGSNGTEVSKSFYENIFTQNAFNSAGVVTIGNADNENRQQGFDMSQSIFRNAYLDAINLLSNQDDYDFNLLTLPGLIDENTYAASILTKAQLMVEGRGDAFLVMDPVKYGSLLSNVVNIADQRNSNYVAEYWPWVLINDADLGRAVWVPAGTVVPSVYAFNDRVAAPWFAPAGLNRGGIDVAIRTERKLDQSNRDTLYDANINPIASFPNLGVAVYGQKTLQKKASALDRVNVRRLLIAAKKFVASTSKYLIFENNTAATRNRFLSIVNPYFDNVQQRQGLYAFKVQMDEKLNTPEVIDRNELRGAIYLQPTKTAEFIIIDFNVLPTGAAFPE
jgi:phage tail sheath protein FI